ncbi:hypothetical protein [uncultured Jatrophihabitans sp.]|uniref:hypothetical protein n=1 Tax=uncultured Jatrophihabitans sp. TaxID=1610747 RepID=UPI0035CB498D
MSGPFAPPEGDGGSLTSAARTMNNVGTDVSHDTNKVKGAVATAQSDWRAKREGDFSSGMFGISAQLVLTEDAVGRVATVMGQYAKALAAATSEVAHLKSQADALQARIDKVPKGAQHGPLLPGGDDPVVLAVQLQALQTRATGVKTALSKLAGQLAAAIDEQTNKLAPRGASLDPAAIRRQVLHTLDVDKLGPNGSGLNLKTAWSIMGTAKVQGQQVLDLVEDNKDGEQAGGPTTRLPTNVAELQQLLDAARADGVAPMHYGALLHQYWVAKAAQRAGIDLDGWDPRKGVDGNRSTISAVYNFYGSLYLKNPRLQWAGLANLVGPTFAGGFMDLDEFKHLATELGKPIDKLPGFVRAALPPELQALDMVSHLSASELGWYEHKFMAMQKHIFFDIGAQHEAYIDGGTTATNELARAGLIDRATSLAWQQIPHGDAAHLRAATTQFANREQNTVIADQYDQMANHDKPIGPVMTYLMTSVGSASLPGTKTPGQYKPLTLGASESLSGPLGIGHEKVSATVTTPLPAFNIADRRARWDYIRHDTLPAYYNLLDKNGGADARTLIGSSIDDRIQQQRLGNRIPQLLHDGLTDWGLEVDNEVGAFGVTVGSREHVGR